MDNLSQSLTGEREEEKEKEAKEGLFDSVLNNVAFQRKKCYESAGACKTTNRSLNEDWNKEVKKNAKKNGCLTKEDKENRNEKSTRGSIVPARMKVMGKGKELNLQSTDQKSV